MELPQGYVARQIFVGSLFGDGSIRRNPGYRHSFYVERHSIRESVYLKWKNRHFGYSYTERAQWTGRKQYGICEIRSPCMPWLDDVSQSFNMSQGWLDRLDALGLLIWYLDRREHGSHVGLYLPTGVTDEQGDTIERWFMERWDAPVSVICPRHGKTRKLIRFADPVSLLMMLHEPFTEHGLPDTIRTAVGLPAKKHYWKK
jgi:hypothetical protein